MSRWRFIAKVLVAILALSTFAVVAGRSLAPAVAWWRVLLWAGGGAGLLACLLAAVAFMMGAQNQFTLKRGGTDAQWMWFGGEPPGLTRERERSAKAAADPEPPESADPRG